MTSKNIVDPDGDDSLGVLDDTASSDTVAIGPQDGTAQVSVTLPTGGDDDDLIDDEVVGGEVVSELVIDTSAVADDDVLARISRDTPEIVIELPAEETGSEAALDEGTAEPAVQAEVTSDVVDEQADVVDEQEPSTAMEAADADVSDAAVEPDAVDEPAAAAPAADLSDLESAVAAAKAQLREAMSPAPGTVSGGSRPPRSDPAAGENPGDRADRAEERSTVAIPDRPSASRQAADLAPRAADHDRGTEMTLTSKRIDDLGDSGRESADLLTADRLLDPSRITKPEPEGAWSHLLYAASGGRINIGDGRRARERKALRDRIAAPVSGTARFIPVLSRKGGVGKTTVTALLGMALADAREDRVIAVDANPDRGTLAERVAGSHAKSVRDVVRAQHDIRGFHDLSALVARDRTRLDVLASDADPHVSEAFGDADYRDVAAVAAQYYSLVLTDSGTGIVHSVMGATLDLADQIVVVSGLSVDEARLASETLTWLESNGHAQLAHDAIVVLNQSTPGTPMVRLSELESHFSTRARHVLRIPYDPQIAGGSVIEFEGLQPATRRAIREIAAVLVDDLRAGAS